MAAVLLTVAVALLLIFITVNVLKYLKLRRIIDQFDGPPALPIIGNAHMFEPKATGKITYIFHQNICKQKNMPAPGSISMAHVYVDVM